MTDSGWQITRMLPADEVLVPEKDIAAHLNKTPRTLVNWDEDPKMLALGWPPVVIVNGKRHRQLGPFRAFYRALTAQGGGNVDQSAA